MRTLVIIVLAIVVAAIVFLGVVVRRFFPLTPFAERGEGAKDKH